MCTHTVHFTGEKKEGWGWEVGGGERKALSSVPLWRGASAWLAVMIQRLSEGSSRGSPAEDSWAKGEWGAGVGGARAEFSPGEEAACVGCRTVSLHSVSLNPCQHSRLCERVACLPTRPPPLSDSDIMAHSRSAQATSRKFQIMKWRIGLDSGGLVQMTSFFFFFGL